MTFSQLPCTTTLVNVAQLVFKIGKCGWFTESRRRFIAFQCRVIFAKVDMQISYRFVQRCRLRMPKGQSQAQVGQCFCMCIQSTRMLSRELKVLCGGLLITC